ncbi:MAG: hypothetical protein WKG06_42545 [Segetibacter sp.]
MHEQLNTYDTTEVKHLYGLDWQAVERMLVLIVILYGGAILNATISLICER